MFVHSIWGRCEWVSFHGSIMDFYLKDFITGRPLRFMISAGGVRKRGCSFHLLVFTRRQSQNLRISGGNIHVDQSSQMRMKQCDL